MRNYLAIALMILFSTTAAASADTDYACLKGCISGGGSYTSCMPKCAYNTAVHPFASNASMNAICLKTCTDTGGPAAQCVPQCTSATALPTAAEPLNPNTHTVTSVHDIFKAPVEANDVVLAPKRTQDTLATPDYTCVKLCMQGGMQFAFCEQRCITPR